MKNNIIEIRIASSGVIYARVYAKINLEIAQGFIAVEEPLLNVATQGLDFLDAKYMIIEALKITLEELLNDKHLSSALRECGYIPDIIEPKYLSFVNNSNYKYADSNMVIDTIIILNTSRSIKDLTKC